MRNKLIYLFLGLSVLSCVITKQESPDNTNYQIRHTKSISYKAIKVDGQILPGEYFEYGEENKGAVVFHNYYGQNGRMVGHEYLDVNNKVISKLKMDYNEKKEVVAVIEYNRKKRRMDTLKYLRVYEDGVLVQLTKKSKSKEEKHYFKYDDRGNKIRETVLKPARINHNIRSRERIKNDTIQHFYDYDKKNNLIKKRVVRPHGYVDIYDYDGKGNLLSQQTTDAAGNQIWGVTNRFDKRGNEIESTFYFDGKLESKSYEKYNKKNQHIESCEFGPDGILDSKGITEYNLQGDWSKDEFYQYRPEGTPRKRKWFYKYDEQGNWIEQIYILNDEPQSFTKRKIDYY